MDHRGNAAGPALEASQLEWSRVTGHAERIVIVACGPSLCLKTLDLARKNPHLFIIAVNRAIVRVRPDAWFTLDPDSRVLPIMSNCRPSVDYFAAVPEDYGRSDARVEYHRVKPARGIHWLRRITGTGPYKSRYSLSDDPGRIHTGNSAWGALGLAYLMRPRKIAFMGLDATREPYGIVPGAPRGSMSHLPALFESSIRQLDARNIEVVNGSPTSRVVCFPKMSPSETLNWISE